MVMSKTLGAAIAVALLASASPASAGEWRGTTKPGDEDRTPIHDMFYDDEKGPSICAFSGLNDEYYLEVEGEHTRTQSYGTSVANGGQDPHVFNPGAACNMGN